MFSTTQKKSIARNCSAPPQKCALSGKRLNTSRARATHFAVWVHRVRGLPHGGLFPPLLQVPTERSTVCTFGIKRHLAAFGLGA